MRTINKKIGFIGSGNMAQAIIGGLLSQKIIKNKNISSSDPSQQRRNQLSKEFSIKTFSDNIDVVKKSDVVILAVKPQIMEKVLKELKGEITSKHLIISIAAGIPIEFISKGLGDDLKIIRVMPNAPALVKEGISAISPGENAGPEDLELAKEILNAIGKTVSVEESYLNAVTGLSGSGPAYIFLIIESLIEGGVAAGLPWKISKELVLQTVSGSVSMLKLTGKHPGELKDMVTSPGGTTIAGLKVLENKKVRYALIEAVEAATKKAAYLGKKVKK